jgi:hypothetical protein
MMDSIIKLNSLKTIELLSLCLLLFSCNNTESELIEFMESNFEHIENSILEIDLEEAFNTQYDTLYLFGEFTQSEEISSVIGIEYNGRIVSDSKKRIILVENGCIVFETNISTKNLTFLEITHHINSQHKNLNYLEHHCSKYSVQKGTKKDQHYLLRPVCSGIQYRLIDHNWQNGYIYEELH